MKTSLFICFLVLVAVLFSLMPARAFGNAGLKEFRSCMARLETTSIKSGVSPRTVKSVLESVRPVERVKKADREQPEFFYTFRHYLDSHCRSPISRARYCCRWVTGDRRSSSTKISTPSGSGMPRSVSRSPSVTSPTVSPAWANSPRNIQSTCACCPRRKSGKSRTC